MIDTKIDREEKDLTLNGYTPDAVMLTDGTTFTLLTLVPVE